MGRATSLRRFFAPLLVFFFAFLTGYLLKFGLDYISSIIPEAKPVSQAVETYLDIKYGQRFIVVKQWLDPLWGIFILNTITYSMNLWLGPFCYWLTTLFKQEPTPKIIKGFTNFMNRILEVATKKSPSELLFLYLAPLTLVFWLGFDGGMFNNLVFFTQPHAWLEFFVAFYAASIGLSLSEISLKRGLAQFLFLIPLIFLAAIFEAPLVMK